MSPRDPAAAVLAEVQGLVAGHTNGRVEAWKAAGRPVVGYFCSYAPPELLLSLGALPLRLRGVGCTDSSAGDAYLSGRTCTHVRRVMSLVLDGAYDFLDGQVSLNTCDHVRRAADVFVKKSGVPFHGFLSVPRALRMDLFPWYVEELRKLRAALAAHLGVDASDDRLREAIATLNAVRDRLRRLASLRLLEQPRLTGAEALAVHIAAQVLPPVDFLELTDRLLPALAARDGRPSPRGRLILAGAELDEPAFVEAVESQGALVVADRLCFGARSVLDPIDERAADPLLAVAHATFFRPSCARMIGDFPARWDALAADVARARADGVVFVRLVFCDPWGADLHNLTARARAAGLPLLPLSREHGVVPAGQVRTRVQAFLERIEVARASQRAGGNGGPS